MPDGFGVGWLAPPPFPKFGFCCLHGIEADWDFVGGHLHDHWHSVTPQRQQATKALPPIDPQVVTAGANNLTGYLSIREENMRILTLCALLILIALVPAIAASLSSTAQSGVKTDVAEHSAYNNSCVAQRIVVTITMPPTNGTVATTIENKTVPPTGRLGGPQSCAGTSLPTAVVYYQSKPNFKGTDQFKYQRINQDNPKDRLNGEIVLTVTVK